VNKIRELLVLYWQRGRDGWDKLPKEFRAAVLVLAVLGPTVGLFLQAQHAQDLSDPERARRQGKPMPVRTTLVADQEIEEVVGATALTYASDFAPVQLGPSRRFNTGAPNCDLLLKKVYVHEGDVVRQDQVLFELDDSLLRKMVDECEAALSYARAKLERVREQVKCNPRFRDLDLEAAKDQHQFRIDDLKRREDEYEAYKKNRQGGASSQFQLLDAFSAFIQARFSLSDAKRNLEKSEKALPIGELHDKEDLAAAKNNVALAEVALVEAQRDLQRARITSPIDGVVATQDIVAGIYIASNTVLTNVLKIDPIFVRLDFPQERIDQINLGQKVEVALDSFPQETFSGKVIRISPRVDPKLRVLAVVVELSNPRHRIKAGISGFVRVATKRKATVTPAAAVLRQNNKAMVFRVENGRAHSREVQVGRITQGELLPVEQGLVPGDEVVVFHNFYWNMGKLTQAEGYLKDNDAVDTDWRKWARRD
jgi:RND family efflux transporter MFP subunit